MAAGKFDNRIDEGLLKCHVCLERYKNPKMLPCHHSFCELCLVKLKGLCGVIKCPNCGKHHSVSDIQQFPPSMIIQSALDVIEEQEMQRDVGPCHGCQENLSINRCVDCAMNCCTLCAEAHIKSSVSRNHRIVTLKIFNEDKLRDKSKANRERLIDIFPNKCHLCVGLGQRDADRGAYDMQEVSDTFCEMATYHIERLEAKRNEAKQSKESATKQSEEIAKQYLERKQQIKKHSQETIAKLSKIIKQEETSHLRKLENDYNKMNNEIKRKMHQIQTTEELLTSTIILLNNLLQYSSATQPVKTGKETTNQLETMTSLETTWNNYNALPTFYAGDVTLQGMLGAFHNIEVDSLRQTRGPSNRLAAPMVLERTIGERGTKPGKFDLPLGMSIDQSNDIVVADNMNERVQIIDIYGRPKSQINFTGYSKPVRPIDVAISADNKYFITDGTWGFSVGNNQVIVCNQYGKVIKCFGRKELHNPYGIAINHNNGIVYVVDSSAHCIRLYKMSDYEYIRSVGEEGEGSCQFEDPQFIAINSKGCIIVSDAGNSRIQVLTSDGVFMFAFGGYPNEMIDWPWGITTDESDNIYICEYNYNRLQKFNSEGKFVTNIASGGHVLDRPRAVAITMDGKVIVTDDSHSVKVFS
ncbi:E3 ubiquitin-protein ligase TRIM32-like [Saccoglossus kowalevskii]|uniref:RING finger protein nhl-1-like n=1 Tax=Saccoglossus kowalevskii TaxID=10224 RepID=A0ABM0GUM9_SACKO|nr:PREDICTED: RING finger protein nhl-1-like [Saccoglossus kowalevskii]